MAIGSFKLPISTSTSPAQWTKPAEWIDISTVGDNEINLLVSDGTGISFATTVASSGTYTIDWGDGTVETGRASGTTYQHQYNYSGGTYCANLGYWVYKVRIYGATGNITRWQVKRHSFTTRKQYLNILWAVFGTTALTDCSSTFYDTVGLTAVCQELQACTLPTSWKSVTTTSYMFNNCSSLSSIVLPTSWGSVTTVLSMFNGCYSLKTITGLDYLGHQSLATNGTDLLKDCQYLQGTLTVAAFLSKIGIYGTSAYLLQCTGIRLTNAKSTFGGTSPQVNVSYTSLDATALNTLFGDLPTLTGKTITITGCPGAATCDTSIATAKGWKVIN